MRFFNFYFVDRVDLESIQPKTAELLKLHDGSEVRGIIISLLGEAHLQDQTRGLKQHHFISRYFAPWVGIPEDPVTGKSNILNSK